MKEEIKHVTYEEGVMNLVTAIIEQVAIDYTQAKAREYYGNVTEDDMKEINIDVYFFLHSDLLKIFFIEEERKNIIDKLDEMVDRGYCKNNKGKWVRFHE